MVLCHLAIQQEDPAVLTGRVVDPDKEPVAGAEVVVLGEARLRTIADGEGRFAISGVDRGGFEVVARHDDWAGSEQMVVAPLNGAEATLDIALRVGGRIRGKLFDDEGEPIAGATILVSTMDYPLGEMPRYGTTGTEGEFEIDKVTPGQVTVHDSSAMQRRIEELQKAVKDAENGADLDPALMMNMSMGAYSQTAVEDGQTIEVQLGDPAASPIDLHGFLLDETGPVAGAWLSFVHMLGTDPFGPAASTGEDGAFSIRVALPGFHTVHYQVDLDRTGRLAVEVPEEGGRLDLRLTGTSVHGRLLDSSGVPLSRGHVYLMSEEGFGGPSDLVAGLDYIGDSEGRFRIDSLEPGSYSVHAQESMGPDETVPVGFLEVSETDPSGPFEGRLPPTGSIRANVVDSEGNPVERSWVYVYMADGRPLRAMPASANELERISVPSVPVGEVDILAITEEGCSPIRRLTVARGEEVEIELAITPGPKLEVEVLEGNSPAPARILVRDQAGRRMDGVFGGILDLPPSQWFTAARRTLGPLPPGEYTLVATGFGGKTARKKVKLAADQEKRSVKLRLR